MNEEFQSCILLVSQNLATKRLELIVLGHHFSVNVLMNVTSYNLSCCDGTSEVSVVISISCVVISIIKQSSLLHSVLLRHLVAAQQTARAPTHRPGLVLDPLCHAA